MFGTNRGISDHPLRQIEADVADAIAEAGVTDDRSVTRSPGLEPESDLDIDSELNEIYGDDAEPNDAAIFDLMDDEPIHHLDPCPQRPAGLPHDFIGGCGETKCRFCRRIVACLSG